MPRPYPPEFRACAVALVRAGEQAKQTTVELCIHAVTLSNWIRQDDIDHVRTPSVPSSESAELRAAKRRIRKLETELLIVRQAAKFLDEERPPFSTLTVVASSAGRSTPSKTPRLSSTRSTWPSGIVAQSQEGSFTRITERNSPRGSSERRSAPPGPYPRSAPSVTGWTTR